MKEKEMSARRITNPLHRFIDIFQHISDFFHIVEITFIIFAIIETLIRYKAQIRFLSLNFTLENVPVTFGLTYNAYIGLRFTPPPPSDVDINDPRVPKMLFYFAPLIVRYPISSEGMQYDLDLIFFRKNVVVEKAYLRKNTGLYIPSESYDMVLEVYHYSTSSSSSSSSTSRNLDLQNVKVGDKIEITITPAFGLL
ncbi:MAG: hypothetical protein QXF17_02720 [Ignisphaera sp.]